MTETELAEAEGVERAEHARAEGAGASAGADNVPERRGGSRYETFFLLIMRSNPASATDVLS